MTARRTFTAGLFLIAGAVVTSGVALTCAVRSNLIYESSSVAHVDSSILVARVARHQDAFECSNFSGFGIRHVRALDLPPGNGGFLTTLFEQMSVPGTDGRKVMSVVFDGIIFGVAGFEEVAAGWPWKAYRGWRIWPAPPRPPGQRRRCGTMMPRIDPEYAHCAAVPARVGSFRYEALVPLRPIWYGLLADSVFYGFLIWVTVRMIVALRARNRVRRGMCPRCRYPIGISPFCTECGSPLPERATPPSGARSVPLVAREAETSWPAESSAALRSS